MSVIMTMQTPKTMTGNGGPTDTPAEHNYGSEAF